MNSYINSNEIIKIFKLLNNENIDYILLRNINNELPKNLKIGKDIDILVSYEKRNKIYSFFDKLNFNKVLHPHRNDIFLYGVKKFEFFKHSNNNIIFDLNFHLLVRSLDAGQWIPLDQIIQESAWKNRRFEKLNNEFGYWTLGFEDEFITLIARSIFDKKKFQIGYIQRVEELYPKINLDDVMEKMKLIFFKYTPLLLEQIEKREYENIIKNYIQFKEY